MSNITMGFPDIATDNNGIKMIYTAVIRRLLNAFMAIMFVVNNNFGRQGGGI